MAEYHSKRAEILRKVLDYVNHEDWDEFDGFMIFGKDAFDIWTGVLEASPDYDGAPFRNAESKSKVSRGKRAIAKRVKLGTPPEDETLSEFRKNYELRTGEIVDHTRKIVIDLYILRGKSTHSQ